LGNAARLFENLPRLETLNTKKYSAMNKEQFLSWLKDYEESTKYAKACYQAFSTKLKKELTELVFNYLPVKEKKCYETQERVCEIVEKYTKEVKECFEWVNSSFYNKNSIKEVRAVPKQKTKEDAEKQLVEELKDIPKEHHELYTKYHWEDYEHDKRHADFLFAVFNKMKEVLVEIYFESIVDFDGDYLRRLDYGIYLMCAGEFVQAVYELE
jgi:hypothetical protein